MCSGMVFTASGMLTKQMLVQHPFRNAADGFRNAVDVEGRLYYTVVMYYIQLTC